MRKRIGLVTGEQDNDYAISLVDHIFEEACKNDCDVFVFSNYGVYDHNVMLYGEGEISVYKIPDLDSFDGFILDETLYNISGMGDIVYSYFEKNVKCPVVSLKKKTSRFYDILLGERDGIKAVTNHFIKDHGFKKIAHMTGRWELQDARVRYQGYDEAMEEANLNISNDMVFYGDYWKNKAGEAVDFFSQNGYPEAIVCANDFMAIAVCDELAKRGVRVPEDVCVSGYDNEIESSCQSVPITTLDANIPEFGRLAFYTLLDAIEGKTVPKEQYVQSTLLLRDSCGCKHCTNNKYSEFKLADMTRHYYGIDMNVYMYNGYQSAFEIDDIFTIADTYFRYNFSNIGYICLCSDALASAKRPVELINEYTKDMVLKRIFYLENGKNYDSPEEVFERKDILPMKYFDTPEPVKYYITPLHAQNKCYGYIVSVYPKTEHPYHFTQSYAAALGNALDSYNFNTEYMNMEAIKSMYLTDPLTAINNRRGYEQGMVLVLDKAKRRVSHLSVVSIDMDDLKIINDTYGHQAGDECLSALARALKSVVSEEEVIARFGGDEFAAILASPDPYRHTHFEADLLNAIDAENALMNKEYSVHASIGLVYIGTNIKGSLAQHIQSADQIMYAKKSEYKKTLNREVR